MATCGSHAKISSFELHPSLLPALTDAVPAENGELSVSAKGTVFTVTNDTLVKQKTPDGIDVGNLTKDLAEYIAQNWIFRSPGVKEFVERLITTGLPNVALRTSTDRKLQAYLLTQPHNTIGMAFVQPRYRKQRLGCCGMNHLAGQLLLTSPIVAMMVEDHNMWMETIVKEIGWVQQHKFINVQFRSATPTQ